MIKRRKNRIDAVLKNLSPAELHGLIELELTKPDALVNADLIERCDVVLAGNYQVDMARKERVWANIKECMNKDASQVHWVHKRPLLIAICLMVLLIGTTVCMALDILPWKLDMKWDDDKFHISITDVASLDTPSKDMTHGLGRGDDFDAMLTQYAFSPSLPQWLPNGLQIVMVNAHESDGIVWSISAVYENADNSRYFSITVDDASDFQGTGNMQLYIEKDDGPVELVERGMLSIYLYSNLDDFGLYWSDYPYVVTISGCETMEEARLVANSVIEKGD